MNEYPPAFFIDDVGQSDTHLYVALRYRGPRWISGAAPAAELVATLHVGGCKAGNASARGQVRQSGDGVSWVEIPLAELPDGEIELRLDGRIGSASAASSLSLRKAGSSVEYLPLEQKRGYHRWTEKNPVTGEAMSFVTVDEPDTECVR